MIYGYIRVSTDKQTLENKKFEIRKFCDDTNIKIDRWICETTSGTIDFQKRKLGTTLKKLNNGDILICSEISRLGRSLLQIMAILNICLQKKAQVWTIKDNFRLGLDIQSKVLAFAFSLSAEIERNLISQRTKEALARLKAEGKKLGRQNGSKNKKHIIDGKEKKIFNLLNTHVPKAEVARQTGISLPTLYTFLKKNNF